MKKISLVVLPAITIALEILPLGAVCIFAPSPTERAKETFSYFSPIPFGYANFAPLITAVLTVVILLLSLISLKKNGVFNSMFVLSIITAVISLLPLVYGLSYFTFVGALITMALVLHFEGGHAGKWTRICIGRTSHRAIPLCHMGLL